MTKKKKAPVSIDRAPGKFDISNEHTPLTKDSNEESEIEKRVCLLASMHTYVNCQSDYLLFCLPIRQQKRNRAKLPSVQFVERVQSFKV